MDTEYDVERAVRIVARGEELQPTDAVASAYMFREAAELTLASGKFSMCAGAREREVRAWAAAGDANRARRAADHALVALDSVEDHMSCRSR